MGRVMSCSSARLHHSFAAKGSILELPRSLRVTAATARLSPVGLAGGSRALSTLPLPAGHRSGHDKGSAASGQHTVFQVTARDHFEHFAITQELGLVSAADVRSKSIIKDVLAAISGVVGGETTYYSHLLNETCEAAMDKLVSHAKSLGADGVVNVRLESTTTMNRLIVGLHTSVLAYGTAVKLGPPRPRPER
jgi:uncharacterized protein YbjQ (UPF0145 family)